MFYFATITLMLHLPLIFGGIDVRIDGMIDLGPNWHYKYQIQPYAEDFDALSKSESYADPQQFRGVRRKRKKKNGSALPSIAPENYNKLRDLIVSAAALQNHGISKREDYHANNDKGVILSSNNENTDVSTTDHRNHEKNQARDKGVTKLFEEFPLKELYGRVRRVKNDELVRGFIEHVFAQSLNVFNSIKDKVPDRHLRNKIDSLSDTYKDKFIEYSNETQTLKIKSKLGAQKVILNTIDTSNRILTRLVNNLLSEVHSKGALRGGISAANVFQKEVEKETESELQHACKKFGICRSTDGFSRFLVDVISNLLHNKDHKLKQACDALTEVLKNTDMGDIIDERLVKRFHSKVSYFEKIPSDLIRPGLLILRNTIAHKNKPLAINGQKDERVNKTLAFLSLIDTLDTKLPSNEENKLEWQDIRNSLVQWGEGRRRDIEEIMQTFVDHLKKGISELQATSVENANFNMEVLLN